MSYTYDDLELMDGQILKPLEGKTGKAGALIFLIGDSCENEAYLDQLKMV